MEQLLDEPGKDNRSREWIETFSFLNYKIAFASDQDCYALYSSGIINSLYIGGVYS